MIQTVIDEAKSNIVVGSEKAKPTGINRMASNGNTSNSPASVIENQYDASASYPHITAPEAMSII